jgi:hypothetical protein
LVTGSTGSALPPTSPADVATNKEKNAKYSRKLAQGIGEHKNISTGQLLREEGKARENQPLVQEALLAKSLPETNNSVSISGPNTPQSKDETFDAEAEAANYWGSLFKEEGKKEYEPMFAYLVLSIYNYHVSKSFLLGKATSSKCRRKTAFKQAGINT